MGLKRAAISSVDATTASWDTLARQGEQGRLQKGDAAEVQEPEQVVRNV